MYFILMNLPCENKGYLLTYLLTYNKHCIDPIASLG